MLQKTDCDVIARTDGFEITKTGKFTKTIKPIVHAWRYLENDKGGVIGFEGVHPYGFTVGGKASSSSSIPAQVPSGFMNAVTLAGLTVDARLYSFNFRQDSGVPGHTTLMDFLCEASDTNRYCIQVDQQMPEVQGGLKLIRVNGIGDGPSRTAGLAHWFVRPCSAIEELEMEECIGTNFREYALAYWDNAQKRVRIVRCIANNAGRGGIQGTNREFSDAQQTKPTHQPSTHPDAVLEILDTDFIDCASFWNDDKQKFQANGSACTIVDWTGSIDIRRTRIIHTHPGGGGFFIGHDAKAGTFKTPAKNRVGATAIDRCEVRTIGGAIASRDAVKLGAMDSLTWGENLVDGTLPGMLLHDTGTIPTIWFNSKKPSHPRYWGKTAPKVRIGTKVLSDSEIDAFSSAA